MQTVYIIGSMSRFEYIRDLADRFTKSAAEQGVELLIKYPTPIDANTKFGEAVSRCFDNIEEADKIVIIPKLDGTFGEGTTYEMEYVKRLGKDFIIFDECYVMKESKERLRQHE